MARIALWSACADVGRDVRGRRSSAQPSGIWKRWFSAKSAYSLVAVDSSSACWYSSSQTSEMRLKNSSGKMNCL